MKKKMLAPNSEYNPQKSYASFEGRGMSVDLTSYLKTPSGQAAFLKVSRSAFPQKTHKI